MKKLLILFSLFAAHVITGAEQNTTIILPSAATLIKRLHNNGFEHFAQTTGIVAHLADEIVLPARVRLVVSCALHEYAQHAENAGEAFKISLQRNMIMRLILQDYPDVLHSLRL